GAARRRARPTGRPPPRSSGPWPTSPRACWVSTRWAPRRGAAQGPAHRAPATPLERALADITASLLGLDSLGADDDFFALGGDSVLATQLVARTRAWLDTPTVMVADIFAARTVAALATLLQGREAGSDRLEQVAEVYLEVADMESSEVASALDSAAAP
ncbi:phosphopantetheine-binding protein, partial [Mycolicibacterium chitae]|uniref:phosphopantetheine-binding protein n=1 Tax=Mycolicibacterium chitae TaxID=1792 RepID=UPI0021F260CC